MKRMIVWMAALAFLGIGGQAYAEEWSRETAGNQETLIPESNPADQEGAQRRVENKNTAYALAQEAAQQPLKPKTGPPPVVGQVVGQVVGGDRKPGGTIQVVVGGNANEVISIEIPKSFTVVDEKPVPPKPPSRTDANFDPDANPLS